MAKKKTPLALHDEVITSKIYLVRGQKVMLDRDLAELYSVKAIRLREQVKRNTERFPDTFMFQLTSDEVENMVSQNAIPSRQHLGGYLKYSWAWLFPLLNACHGGIFKPGINGIVINYSFR
jgi:hypothetical protein